MKKKLIGLLASLACLACLAGCSNPLYSGSEASGTDGNSANPSQSSSTVDGAQSYDAKGAAAYIADMYKAKEKAGREDYSVVKKVMYDGATYTVTWSVNVDCVKVEVRDNDVLINVDEDSATEVEYTLTATVTAPDGSKESVSINRILKAAPSVVPQPITSAPSENETYKLYMYQVTKKADLYFTGKMSDYYLATTNFSNGEDYTKGVDIKVKKVEGKDSFYLTFIDPADSSGSKVQYIGIINNYSNGKWRYNAVIGGSPEVAEGVTGTYEFTYSAEYGTMVATLEGVKSGEDEATTETKTDSFYLGTYSSYWTIGASSVSRIKDDDACVACLAVMQDKSSISADTKVETEKNALSVQTSHTGAVSLDLPVKGATYSDVAISWAVKSGSASIENGKLTVAAPSETSEIVITATLKNGDVTKTVDFTITVYAAASSTIITAPEADVAYTMYLYQATLGKNYYLTGEKDGNFLATTEKASQAAKVYAEVVDGGYKFYVSKDGVKSYIALTEYMKEGKNYYSASIDYASEGTVFYYDEVGCWVAQLENDKFFIGTYQSFTTISASSSYYMTEDKIGTEQFPVVLALITGDIDDGGETPENPDDGGNTEKPNDSDFVTAPVADTAYLMTLEQKTLGKTLYLTGAMDGKFLGMTETAAEAANVYVEVVDGGYKFYVVNDNVKSYIALTEYQKEGKNYYSASIAWAEEGSVFHYESVGCWAATLANDTFFIGTYQSFATASASSSYYMTADKMGTEQFPLQMIVSTNSDGDNTNPGGGGETPDDGGETPVLPSTPAEIVDAAWALASGETLEGTYTLTGVITELGTYNASYSDINVTIVVEGKDDKPMYCYALKGATDGQLAVGDTITVTGTIKNYNGKVEFEKPQLDSHIPGEGGETPDDGGETPDIPPVESALQEGVAYTISANNANGPLYFKGSITSGRFDCSTNFADAVSVYVENVEGGQLLYMLNGTDKVYFVFDDKAAGGSTTSDASAATVFEWNATLNTLVVAEDSNNRAFGAGATSTYESFSAYDAGQNGYNWGVFTPAGNAPEIPDDGGETPDDGGNTEKPNDSNFVTAPVTDTAYLMTLEQKTLGKTLYLTGAMDGKFLGMTETAAEAANVYVEVVDGGYKFYVVNDNVKSYIALTEYQKEGKNYYSASIAWAEEGSVFHYESVGCWAATLANDTFFIGTYQSFATASASSSYYMTADKMGTEQFPLQMIVSTNSDGGNTNPDDGGETPDTPVVDPDATSLSFNAAEYAAANGWTNGTLYESAVLADGATIVTSGPAVGSYNLNTGKYYTGDSTWRIYQTENATLTITAAEGKTIASVKVTYLTKNTGILSLDGTQIESDTVVTVNGASITFGVENSGTATNGQVKITAIEIIYA